MAFSMSGCQVTVYEYADQSLSIGYGPHIVGRYDHSGAPLLERSLPHRRARRSAAKSKLPVKKKNQLWK